MKSKSFEFFKPLPSPYSSQKSSSSSTSTNIFAINFNIQKKRKRDLWLRDYFLNHPSPYRKIKPDQKTLPPLIPSPAKPKTEFYSFKPVYINTNPNFRYHSTILTTNESSPLNEKFEVFRSIRDGKTYLVSPNSRSYCLEIIYLGYYNNKLITRLKGHPYYITTVRYFLDKKNNKEYLISADGKNNVIVWDITYFDKNDYNNEMIKKIIISTKYKNNFIYSCLLFFNINNSSNNNNPDNYIITSSNSKEIENDEFTRVYSLTDGSFIKNTFNSNTNYLLSWVNEKEVKSYLIELCSNGILVYNIFEEQTYMERKDNNNYMGGFIYEKEEKSSEILVTNLLENFIFIYDLYKKDLSKKIEINASSLYYSIQINERYMIVTDLYTKSFNIIDIIIDKTITKIRGKHSVGTICVKKINHPKFGESLLTSGKDNLIKIWIK